MNKSLMLIPLAIGLISSPLYAADRYGDNSFADKARVVDVAPLYETVEVPTDRQECWTEEVQGARSHDSGAGMVLGGIIGGVIGNQLGRGEMRKATTVAGTVIGAAVGHDTDRRAQRPVPYTTTERHCRVRTEYVPETRLRAYRVTYRYRGETFVTEMDHDPGKFVPVQVRVSLMD